MRGPSRQTNALDGPAAARARHPGSAVNTKLLLKFPLAAGGTDVIANAGATLIDGTVQNRNDGLTQTLSLPGCRILSELAGMQARFEQRFIRINIANAGYHALIQQDGLEAAPGCRKTFLPVIRVQVKRLWPQARILEKLVQPFGLGEQGRAAEAANIAKAQLLSSAVQAKHQMRMIRDRSFGRHHRQLSGHAQVHDEVAFLIETKDNPFAATANFLHALADQFWSPKGPPAPSKRPPSHLHLRNPPPHQSWT